MILAKLRRLGRDDGGQALAEYAILMAIAAGASLLDKAKSAIEEAPPGALLVWGAVVVETVAVLMSSEAPADRT